MISRAEFLRLLTSLSGLPTDIEGDRLPYSRGLYIFSLENKVVLQYLSKCRSSSPAAEKLYRYHLSRYKDMASLVCEVGNVLESHGFRYAVFKTIKPFMEDVADIDLLSFQDDAYGELVEALRSSGLELMERSHYSTTFMKPSRYFTELMVDVYREVSVGPLIYLDKRLLESYVTARDIGGCRVRVLNPVAELLVTIAHSLIKEREVKLLDYLTSLHLLREIDYADLAAFSELVERAKLRHGTKLFLSIIIVLYGVSVGSTYSGVSKRISKLLDRVGGYMNVSGLISGELPPYRVNSHNLARMMIEKIDDRAFRVSMLRGLRWFLHRRSVVRLVNEASRVS